jgi:uncharacterized protein (TIGR01777 family)
MKGKGQIIALSGASGFVGSNLSRELEGKGYKIIPLGRKEFSLSNQELADILKPVDSIINLAGAPVINRWTEEYKKTMYDSRVSLTRKLVDSCALLDKKPGVVLSASAVGCYSSAGIHTEEDHVLADDFLGKLTKEWEHEAFRANDLGIRTAVFRFGVVLGKGGGALAKMLTPFKLGLGGVIGSGQQAFSWIHIRDLIRIFGNALSDPGYEGIYNLTAPNPTTNKGLTKALGKALSRPTFLSVPEFVLRMQFGEGAQVLTSGQHVIPERLLASGFDFEFPDIEESLADCVK